MNVQSFFLSIGLILIGAAAWITCERFEVVPPMCLIDGQLYDQTAKRR